MVEIGQVGQASSSRDANFTFYCHQQQGDAFGDAAPVVKALQDAASSSAGLQVNVRHCSTLHHCISQLQQYRV